MKQCATCKEWKNDDDFNWRYKSLGIRYPTCRECHKLSSKTWYTTHKKDHLRNVKLRKYDVRQQAREYVTKYLLSHPCEKCGETDPIVLEFHHLSVKHKAISQMVADGLSIANIQKEIDKCAVLCANCHRKETAKDQGWFRADKVD